MADNDKKQSRRAQIPQLGATPPEVRIGMRDAERIINRYLQDDAKMDSIKASLLARRICVSLRDAPPSGS